MSGDPPSSSASSSASAAAVAASPPASLSPSGSASPTRQSRAMNRSSSTNFGRGSNTMGSNTNTGAAATATAASAVATTTTTSPTSNISRPPFRRINVVLLCGMMALLLQLWSFRGGIGYLDTNYYNMGTMSEDCQQMYALLQDAPPPPSLPSAGGGGGKESIGGTTSLSNSIPLPSNTTKASMVVMVLSRRNAWRVRQGIRDTWAKHHDNVYFVLGQGCTIPPHYRGVDEGGNSYCKVKPIPLTQDFIHATMDQKRHEEFITKQLQREQEEYHDLLVMSHTIDMYRTLPAKLKYAYTFVHDHLPNVQWVLKVDDDFFVRIDPMEDYLKTKFGDLGTTDGTDTTNRQRQQPQPQRQPILIGGDIRREHAAHMGGKWKELPQYPRGAIYPPFPLGSYGHIVSRSIVDYVVQYQDALFDYQGEDVSIGIWLDQHPLNQTTTFIDAPEIMSNGGDCRRSSYYVVGHDISPLKMRLCQQSHIVGDKQVLPPSLSLKEKWGST